MSGSAITTDRPKRDTVSDKLWYIVVSQNGTACGVIAIRKLSRRWEYVVYVGGCLIDVVSGIYPPDLFRSALRIATEEIEKWGIPPI